ncbi:MAG: FAD-binding protein [Bacteroidota bacterium]
MKKRTFLKRSSALLAGSTLLPMISCKNPAANASPSAHTNWAGNLSYSTDNVYRPESVEGVQEWVRKCEKIRALGSRHCFNDVADSKENQLSFDRLNQLLSLDEAGRTVTVQAGMRYGELAPILHERGFALHNLASLPHISVAGACATATHGSGVGNGNLATAVKAMQFVDAQGEVHRMDAKNDPDTFPGAVVHLGGIGMVTEVTLNIEPTYEVDQAVYLELPRNQLEVHFEEILSAGYSVSLFVDYQSDTINQVWVKRKRTPGESNLIRPTLYGAKRATKDVHPIIEISAESCTQQMGIPGPWFNRLPHFKMDFTPSSGKELQTEYFVPRDRAFDAIEAVYGLADRIRPYLMISEIRTIAQDELWMSTAYHRDSVAIHFTWEQDVEGVQALLPVLEKALEPFDPRPHWGKIFGFTGEELAEKYEKMPEFRQLLSHYDPNGKFRNSFMNRYIFQTKMV